MSNDQIQTERSGLRIKNWRNYQHYRDRDPPWIKLHFNLLTSADWVSLDDAGRVLAVACMLLASRNDGYVSEDPAYIKRVAYLNADPDFGPLLATGFLEVIGDAKTLPLASPSKIKKKTEYRDRGARLTLAPASSLLAFSASDGFTGISDEDRIKWKAAYPACDIDMQLAQMAEWLRANPEKAHKSKWLRFITSWLKRSQDRGGDMKSNAVNSNRAWIGGLGTGGL